MLDFTLKAYRSYLEAIQKQGITFYLFRDLMQCHEQPKEFCLIRHDVDRKPMSALKMAKAEAEMGIQSTYYFRIKNHTFKKDIIQTIENLGHEIGYHYETLSDANGNHEIALDLFKQNLLKLREYAKIDTCSMHGRPFKPFDNRDIWRNKANHDTLLTEFNIIGEVYLDIDYSDIAYITDTGRNWTSDKSNLRDKVASHVKAEFTLGEELLAYFNNKPHRKICFQIHPERWTNNTLSWLVILMKDTITNVLKKMISIIRR